MPKDKIVFGHFLMLFSIVIQPCLHRIQHIFDEDAVAARGVIDQNVGDGADELAVLEDGTAGHECVKIGPKFFHIRLTIS